ncbi:MAG: flavocytochrome c [Oscillospiraceae bacterium]|nr:flavocytochrome c [Oscillospiraceae bacterium]MBR6610451.1 flavocytochrome c [Oscillospiraceae bacterium]
MKKIIALALSAVMMLSMFTACSTEGTTDVDTTSKSADIVVIGAGGAGMTAAIQAAQDGATNVVIIEKTAMAGGNTTRATGGLNASETTFQDRDAIEDSNQLFIDDTMKGGKNINDLSLVTYMAENSAEALYWVNDLGADLTVVGLFGGASVKRIHRPSDTSAVGPVLVKTLMSQIEKLNIPVLYNTKADEILTDENGAVSGVKVTDENGTYTINCKAVVVATGGFGANSEMVEKYNPSLTGFGTTNVAAATGDGIAMGTAIGAATVDMEQIQTHPTVHPETQTMYTEAVRGNGAILVNKEGARFTNEMGTRDVVSAAILEQTDGQAWLVFDHAVRTSLKAIEGYIKAGIVTEAATIEELATAIGADPATLSATMTKFADDVTNGNADEFGREGLELPLTEGNFYACLVAPAIHHTMGGLKINTAGEVLNEEGNAIAGLFAAGEVTGGVHGANRLGGNAVTDIVVFGRTAGTSANAYVAANGGNTEATIIVEKEDTSAVKPEVEANFKDGTYTAVGTGIGGDVEVIAEVKDGEIVSIVLGEHSETEGIFEGAVDGVIPEIIKGQTTEVDVVSGATVTSNAIIEAVEDIMDQAA